MKLKDNEEENKDETDISERIDLNKHITKKEGLLREVADDVKPVIEYKESNNVATVDVYDPLASKKDFTQLGLSENLLQAVYRMNFIKPSKIQGFAIPAILSNPPKNFIGQAQSGTGKTLAFLLSIFSRVDNSKNVPQALCLAPTRELVRQIYSVAQNLAQSTTISIGLCIPGESRSPKLLDHIIIGTPGRIYQLIDKNIISCREIKILVLDEADEMLDATRNTTANNTSQDELQTQKILKKLPKTCQICLFFSYF